MLLTKINSFADCEKWNFKIDDKRLKFHSFWQLKTWYNIIFIFVSGGSKGCTPTPPNPPPHPTPTPHCPNSVIFMQFSAKKYVNTPTLEVGPVRSCLRMSYYRLLQTSREWQDPAHWRPVRVCIWRPGQVWSAGPVHPWKIVFKGNIWISQQHSFNRFHSLLLLLM